MYTRKFFNQLLNDIYDAAHEESKAEKDTLLSKVGYDIYKLHVVCEKYDELVRSVRSIESQLKDSLNRSVD